MPTEEVTPHYQTEPFLVGREDDNPNDAARRCGWTVIKPAGRAPRSSAIAVGKAGAYEIRREPVGCRAYPVVAS